MPSLGYGHTHRCRHHRLLAAHQERVGQCHQHTLRDEPQGLDIDFGQQKHKLVASTPAHGLRGGCHLHQRTADLAQQFIAAGVSEGVVHRLEMVQIEHQHREPIATRLGLRHRLLRTVTQQHLIGQAGQLV